MFVGVCYDRNISLYCQEGKIIETMPDANCMVEKVGKDKCKLEAAVIRNVEGLSVVVLVA